MQIISTFFLALGNMKWYCTDCYYVVTNCTRIFYFCFYLPYLYLKFPTPSSFTIINYCKRYDPGTGFKPQYISYTHLNFNRIIGTFSGHYTIKYEIHTSFHNNYNDDFSTSKNKLIPLRIIISLWILDLCSCNRVHIYTVQSSVKNIVPDFWEK